MNFKANTSYSGEYRVVVSRDKEAKDVKHDIKFSNLITDFGLEAIGAYRPSGTHWYKFSGLLTTFFVGAGSTTPDESDTSLVSQIASTNTNDGTGFADVSNGFISATYTGNFGQGVAAGNVSEIGIGYGENALFSRALIKDSAGNPTTITVLPTDFLTVYYTLRCNIPQTASVFNISAEIDGVIQPITVSILPVNLMNQYGVAATANDASMRRFQGCSSLSGGVVFYSPSGASSGSTAQPVASSQLQNYALGSREIKSKVSAGIDNGNVSGGFISRIQYTIGQFRWQATFDPPIPKDNTRALEFTFGYSWGRA